MRYINPILLVEDLDRSRIFYEELLGQRMIVDLGGFMYYSGEFALRSRDSWRTVEKCGLWPQEGLWNCLEMYFEEADYDGFLTRLRAWKDLRLIHGPTYMVGRRLIRFYDPDGHIIIVGENMRGVIERYLDQGLSMEEISARTHYPLEFIAGILKRAT